MKASQACLVTIAYGHFGVTRRAVWLSRAKWLTERAHLLAVPLYKARSPEPTRGRRWEDFRDLDSRNADSHVSLPAYIILLVKTRPKDQPEHRTEQKGTKLDQRQHSPETGKVVFRT